MDFKDKVVWITGASSGIGEHLAYAFAELGASLVLSGRDRRELDRVAHNCPDTIHIRTIPFDITDYDSLPGIVEQVTGELGLINILINNAGISQRATAAETQFAVDKRLMEVNFLGTVALTKAVLPVMMRQQFGHIVAISSIMGKVGMPRRSAYAASKHALHGFFDSLRMELFAHNIKVTLICPGYIKTNLPINALRGDGTPNNCPEHDRNGMDPSEFALKAIQAITRGEKEVYIGGRREVMAVYFERFLPNLFFRVARKMTN